jgi:hypothetical protein
MEALPPCRLAQPRVGADKVMSAWTVSHGDEGCGKLHGIGGTEGVRPEQSIGAFPNCSDGSHLGPRIRELGEIRQRRCASTFAEGALTGTALDG